MKLIILGAGKGERLWPLTQDKPKLLIEIGGTTLLEENLKWAEQTDEIDEVIIVTGYLNEVIEENLKIFKEKFKKIKITLDYNPFYDITNNLISVWLEKYVIKEYDFLITNGDNLYKKNIFKDFINFAEKDGIYVTIDYKNKYDLDDMKVIIDSNGFIKYINKQIPSEKVSAESVGLCLVKGRKHREKFYKAIIELVKKREYLNKFWLEIFNYLAKRRVKIVPFEIEANSWQELDFHPDIELIKQIIFRKKDQ